jgi:C4-dicarboxylate-specific signal transduction histidine kinase
MVTAHGQVPISENLRIEAEANVKQAETYEQQFEYNLASAHFSKAANYYWAHKNPNKASTLYERALEMSKKIENLNAQFILTTNIGLIAVDLENHDKAINQFESAAKVAQQLGRKSDVASSKINRANSLYEVNKLQQAIESLNEATTIAQEIGEPKLLRNAYSLYTKVYDKMGNRTESTNYFNLYTAISKKIQDEELKRREADANRIVMQAESKVTIVEAEKKATEKELAEKDIELFTKQRILEKAQQEAKEREMEIELLSAQSKLQTAEISRQKLMRNIYIFIIFAAVIIAGLMYYNYNEKKKANILLQNKNFEIRAQAEELEKLNSLKDKLFSIISHDLRSPIASLITLINLTEQGYLKEDGFKNVISELSKNVGYTSSLLENLLRWSQSQLKGTAVNTAIFNISEIISERFELLKNQAEAKSVSISFSIDSSINAFADKDMIELVLRNLTSNAIKFCNPYDKIEISAKHKNSSLEFCVADSGIGISPDVMNNLFGLNMYTSRGTQNEKGTGLGLILCKDFVELNGGHIWAESTLGKGSKFFFTIPTAMSVTPSFTVHKESIST